MTEADRIARAQAKRERRAQREREHAHRYSWSEVQRRRLQAIAVRRLFGLDRHTATWDAEFSDGDWRRAEIERADDHRWATLSWIEEIREAETLAWINEI